MSTDIVDKTVDALVELEPALKGRESLLAVIIVKALADYLRERGEFVGR
jgi:hypothetical protein